MKCFFHILLFFSQGLLSQGSPGPIPQQGNYPLGNGVNSVMQQQVWLQQATTLSQQVNAVTQDALQLQPVVLPPVTSSGDPNVYTSSGTVFVSPSPGPTSSSSTSSSSGFPGQDGDIVLWRTQNTDNLNNIVGNGGITFLDQTCQNEASTLNFPFPSTAKAIVERNGTNLRCHNTFDSALLQSSAVYTVQRTADTNNFSLVFNGPFANMFLNPVPSPVMFIQIALSGGPGQIYSWTGCAPSSSDPSPHGAGNCQGFTSGNPIDYMKATDQTQGTHWERNGTAGETQCGNSLLNFRWYCGISWNSSSTSTTTSSSSSGSFIPTGDHLIWTSQNFTMQEIAGGGGQAFMDGQCQLEAAQESWPFSWSAKALANIDMTGCQRGFSGGSNVWTTTQTPGTFEVIKAGPIDSLFSLNNGPNPTPRYKDGFPNPSVKYTGCTSDGGPSGNNCSNFTVDNSGSFSYGSNLPNSWMFSNVQNCSNWVSRSFYCALASGGGSSSSSASSSSSSSSSSSGGPGPNDHIFWIIQTSNAPAHIQQLVTQGGLLYMNNTCKAEAASKGWANNSNAVAIVNTGAIACKDHLSGGNTVYQPAAGGGATFSSVHNGTVQSMFTAGGPNITSIKRNTHGQIQTQLTASGCDNNGNALAASNCNNWSDGSNSYNFVHGQPLASWLNNATSNCGDHTIGRIKWMCGMKWGP